MNIRHWRFRKYKPPALPQKSNCANGWHIFVFDDKRIMSCAYCEWEFPGDGE
jgi:hypothetical protein